MKVKNKYFLKKIDFRVVSICFSTFFFLTKKKPRSISKHLFQENGIFSNYFLKVFPFFDRFK